MTRVDRRHFLATSAGAAVAASLAVRLSAEETAAGTSVRHSVCKWCYPNISLDDLCSAGKEFGLQSVELLQPTDIPTVRKHGMTCAIMSQPVAQRSDGKQVGGIGRAWNETQNHEPLIEAYEHQIQECARLGVNNLICFSGNRRGLDAAVGLQNCASGLKRLMPIAERHAVTISMELLNSKVNHKDYMCDRTPWGVRLCEAVGSPQFKLLYDIYHMQIMEGDVIATIRDNHQLISHYHTGGVPGRAEIDETQELNYASIARAIVDTGHRGFIGQEFIPRRQDKMGSLRQGVEICSV